MSWGLFVDTDSLYLELRGRFGYQARMDYFKLPDRILGKINESEFLDKRALVIRYGRTWMHFSRSLQRFGYAVSLTDKGTQPMSLALDVMAMVEAGLDGIVLVTASQRIGPVIERLLYSGKSVKVASFQRTIEVGGVEREPPGLILMDQSWLWDGEGEQEFLEG